MATQEVTTQKRAWFSEENEHPGRSGCSQDQAVKGTKEINCSLVSASSSDQIGKKQKCLKKPEEFTLVYNEGKTQADYLLVLKAKPNHLEFSRYGISVSKRVGKAVIRNRVKRILREILRLSKLAPGWDIILIARSPAAVSNYTQLQKSVSFLLRRVAIIAK